MKMIKSLLLAGLIGFVSYQAKATVISYPLLTGTNVNLITNSFKLLSVIVTSTTTNSPAVQFFDSQYNTLAISNAAYVSTVSSVTNYITVYTNYYGRTNFLTNIALVDIVTTNAAATNNITASFTATTPTNSTTTYNNINQNFLYGLWITNNAIGSATLTITYQAQ